MAPQLVENIPAAGEPVSAMMIVEDEELEEIEDDYPQKTGDGNSPIIVWELKPGDTFISETTIENPSETTGDKMRIVEKNEALYSAEKPDALIYKNEKEEVKISTTPVSAASGGYLARPSNIYAETQAGVSTSKPSAEKPVPPTVTKQTGEEILPELQLVTRDNIPAADAPLAHQAQPPLNTSTEDPALQDEVGDQKRRAAERLQKLRNLSFNINAADPNNEFETVPAYIRRNMELYGNTISAVENFYSNIEVKTDENNQAKISTINTFLEGKKPD